MVRLMYSDTPTYKVRTLDRVPDLLALHRLRTSRYPFLLQSVAHGTPQSRFDILFAFPGEELMLSAGGRELAGEAPAGSTDFLGALDEWWQRERRPAAPADAPPFRGGWFVYLAYEFAGQIEPSLKLPGPGRLPVARATRIPAAVIVDHAGANACLVAEAGCEDLLDVIGADCQIAPAVKSEPAPRRLFAEALTEEPPSRYLAAVSRAREYIYDGDVFQANLSREWHGRLAPGVSAAHLYAKLCRANPAPFAGLASWGDDAVISSSPERLVMRRGECVEVRPIAGTRPRHADAARDRALIDELIAHPKEQAEHVMLIDLERNDLGRVCRTGSVEVDEMMVVESYAHVHHIVSNVRGRVAPDTLPGAVIRAVFPGGTITGCPKVRCMEIIAELEAAPRDAYTGSMGYLNRDGDMDLNILIRSLVKSGSELSLRAGAGIVADSVPEAELAETRAKARGLLLALGEEGL